MNRFVIITTVHVYYAVHNEVVSDAMFCGMCGYCCGISDINWAYDFLLLLGTASTIYDSMTPIDDSDFNRCCSLSSLLIQLIKVRCISLAFAKNISENLQFNR